MEQGSLTRVLPCGAGEPCFLPQQFRTQRPISNPTEYTRLWVSEVAGQFQGGVCEVNKICPLLSSLLCTCVPASLSKRIPVLLHPALTCRQCEESHVHICAQLVLDCQQHVNFHRLDVAHEITQCGLACSDV